MTSDGDNIPPYVAARPKHLEDPLEKILGDAGRCWGGLACLVTTRQEDNLVVTNVVALL